MESVLIGFAHELVDCLCFRPMHFEVRMVTASTTHQSRWRLRQGCAEIILEQKNGQIKKIGCTISILSFPFIFYWDFLYFFLRNLLRFSLGFCYLQFSHLKYLLASITNMPKHILSLVFVTTYNTYYAYSFWADVSYAKEDLVLAQEKVSYLVYSFLHQWEL